VQAVPGAAAATKSPAAKTPHHEQKKNDQKYQGKDHQK
jgi:hypothetical protein